MSTSPNSTRSCEEVGADHVPYISLEGNVNMAGGQPFSMANLRELRAYCDKHDIPIMLDATRTIENAWFIREREEGYADKVCTRDSYARSAT